MSTHEVLDFILKGFETASKNLWSFNKRTNYIYLGISIVLALYVYLRQKNRKENFLQYIFNKKVWLSKSAWVDYYFILFNSFFKVLLIAPFLIYGLKLAFNTNDYLLQLFGYPSFELSATETIVYYTIALTIFSDFTTYLIHYAFHKVPFLWEFHKIHHSATSMNPFTQYRIHPIELIANNITNIVSFGLITGIFDYLSNQQISKWTYLGVNVFTLIFNALGANLRHSHVKLKFFNFLEYLFISPFQHQIHHSDNPVHFDKNIGSKFALWDWLFGTLVRSEQAHKINYGLGKEDNKNYNSFLKNLLMPFKNLFLRK